MKQRGLAPIIIVVLIATLAVGGYLIYTQLPKPTTPPHLTIQSTPIPSSIPEATSSTETANPDLIGADWKTSCKNIINDPKTKYKECSMGAGFNSADDKKMCEEIGGQYISCASPCRHDPPGTMCVQICAPICIFQ